MVAFDKNGLKRLAETIEWEWFHVSRDLADSFPPQAAFSLSWNFIHDLIQESIIAGDANISRHAQNFIIFHGLDSFTFFCDHLIRLYTSCKCLNDANAVFCRVSRPNCYTWTAIITAHVELEEYSIALRLFEKMQSDGYSPNKCLLLSILKMSCYKPYCYLGALVHDQLVRVRLESDVALGSILVRVYAYQGFLNEARWIFDHLVEQDIILWNAMSTAYCENASYHSAFNLVDQMLRQGTNPDNAFFLCMLKVCSKTDALEEGRFIHNLLVIYGLESDDMIGSSVIDMYSKCESLNEAQNVFATLRHKTIVTWNSLITGYANLGVSAVELLNQMQKEKFVADKVTFLSVLKSCKGTRAAIEHSARTHDQIVLHGLDGDRQITSALIGIYASCGRLNEAHCLFDKLPDKDAIVWGELMSGCAEHGEYYLTVDLFKTMQEAGLSPLKATCSHMLKACSSAGNINDGMLVHHQIVLYGFDFDDSLGSSLVDLYGKCLKLDDAQKIFDGLSCQDVVVWGTLIAAYSAQNNHAAFKVFQKMQQHGVKSDKLVYLFVIKACGSDSTIEHGRLVHNLVMDSNFKIDMDLVKALVEMYVNHGFLDDACNTFNSSPCQDAFSWGVLIAVCIEKGLTQLALKSFARLQELGLTPDSDTISCVLKACGSLQNKTWGRLIHCCCLMLHAVHLEIVVDNSLVSMYFKCGLLKEAAHIFKSLKNPNVSSWESMITGYVQNGYGLLALDYFTKMQKESLTSGPSTFACTLKSCGIEGLSFQGRLLHDQILRNGVEKDLVVGNALVDMYAKCGRPDEAQKVFTTMDLRDEFSWGAILYCHTHYGDPSNVLQLYVRMQLDGLKPDKVTASFAVKACSSIGVFKLGRLIHDQLIKVGIETDVVVGTSLVHMYAKCSSLKEALGTFNRMHHVNEASWTALLSGSAQDSQMQHVEGYVTDLEIHGFTPDNQTHTSILSGFARAGQTEKTSQYIEKAMESNARIPAINVYNCLIDSLSRVGQLHEAEEVLLTMPMSPDVIGWVSLLTACQTFGGTEVGSDCLDHVARLDLNGTGSYVMMANMYMDTQKRCKAGNVLDMRKNLGAWKLPGKACLELEEGLRVFNVGEDLPSEVEVWNFNAVRKRMREQGFVPQVNIVLESNSNYKDPSGSQASVVFAPCRASQLRQPASTLLACLES